jgi:glycine hydroxymethyltransferase
MTLGASLFTFPHPVAEVSKLAKDIGAKLMYDGAHVLGLIAAKRFQDPLREGADVITASTHKTFPGPQGGIVLANTDEETFGKIQRKIFPALVSNHHLHRLPAMYIALLEMQKFGRDYADQIIKNAQYLGRALDEKGFDVLWREKGFTQSHQLAVNVTKQGGGKFVAHELEKANIIINKNLLPMDDTKKSMNPSGIRLGVQEMTRFGMKEPEMQQIAEFFERTLIKKESPDKIKEEATALRKKFLDVQYCFKE